VVITMLVGDRVEVPAALPAPIEIQDSAYVPSTVTVTVGTTVRWTNRDEETHTVTSDAGLFGSAGLDLDEGFAYTFTTQAPIPYGCKHHPFMHGTSVVQ